MRILNLLCSASILNLVFLSSAFACSCDLTPLQDPEVAIAKTDFAFVGEVLSLDTEIRRFYRERVSFEPIVDSDGTVHSGKYKEVRHKGSEEKEKYRRATFRIDQIFKGHEQISISVLHKDSSIGGINRCGYSFVLGQKYLVYASRKEDSNGAYFSTSGCHGTQLLDDAARHIEFHSGVGE